jgi:hypothetical protein
MQDVGPLLIEMGSIEASPGNLQKFSVSGFYPKSGILNTRKHNVSEKSI